LIILINQLYSKTILISAHHYLWDSVHQAARWWSDDRHCSCRDRTETICAVFERQYSWKWQLLARLPLRPLKQLHSAFIHITILEKFSDEMCYWCKDDNRQWIFILNLILLLKHTSMNIHTQTHTFIKTHIKRARIANAAM